VPPPNALPGGEQIVRDKGFPDVSSQPRFEARLAAELLRPARKDEPDGSIHPAMIRQRIESVFWTREDRFGR